MYYEPTNGCKTCILRVYFEVYMYPWYTHDSRIFRNFYTCIMNLPMVVRHVYYEYTSKYTCTPGTHMILESFETSTRRTDDLYDLHNLFPTTLHDLDL